MRMRVVVLALVAVAAVRGNCTAQEPEEHLQELREKIRQMQSELDSSQSELEKRRGVTRIGGSLRTVQEEEQIVRVYDLHDLFTMAPSYAALTSSDLGDNQPLFPRVPGVSQFSGGGVGGQMSVPSAPRAISKVAAQAVGQFGRTDAPQTSIDELIDAITTSISPTEWTKAGGTSTIADLGASLIISANHDTHDQIERLLQLLRERWKTLRTVSIRADWLWLTESELGQVLLGADRRLPKDPFGVVDPEAWRGALDRAARADDALRPLHAALTCYHAQTVHTLAGEEGVVVTNVSPVAVQKDDNEEATAMLGYEPEVAVLFEGAALQVTPLVNKRGTVVNLDVHSRMSKRVPAPVAGEAATRGAAREAVSALDRPKLAIARLSTTVRAPIERTMLVGGMDFPGFEDAGGRGLYLFVSTSVQELRDDDDEMLDPNAPTAGAEAPASAESLSN